MKYPALMLFTGDWLKDPSLTVCESATRGVWIDLLCCMHEAGRSGELSGTRDQLARLGRCSTATLVLALDELKATGAADVTDRNGVVTVTNRRMKREAKEREDAAKRQRSCRMNSTRNGSVTGDVTEMSPPCINPNHKHPPPPQGGWEAAAGRLYEAYPRREARQTAIRAAEKAIRKVAASRAISPGEAADWLHSRVVAYAASPKVATTERQYIPLPATWFNGGRYDDPDAAWGPKSNGKPAPVLRSSSGAREGIS